MNVRIDSEASAEATQPHGVGEVEAAGRAVLDQRGRDRALDAYEALTPFEQELLATAYRAGISDANDRARALITPAAETLNASVVRSALEEPIRGSLNVEARREEWAENPRCFMDWRVGRLVLLARRITSEREKQAQGQA